jgi:hypothetical protein
MMSGVVVGGPLPTLRMRRAGAVLAGVAAFVFALGCACGSGDPCPEGERPSMGSCLPDGCGEYPFGEFAGGGYVFVQSGSYEDEEDGSEQAPFKALAPAIALSLARADRPLVVVASGTYGERLLLDDHHDGLRIEGVCRRDVQIVSPDDQPTIDLESGAETRVTLTSLQAGNPRGPAVVVGGGHLVLSRFDVTDAVAVGLAAYGGDTRVELSDVTVTRTERHPDVGSGYGIAAGDGAQVTASGVSIAGAAVAGVLVDGSGTALWMSSSTVDGRVGVADLSLQGAGVLVANGAEATLLDTELASPWDVGIAVSGPSTASLTRVTLIGVLPAAEGGVGGGGTGVSASGGAQIEAVDLSVHGASLYGVAATGAGTAVHLDQLRIVDAISAPGGPASSGIGLVATDGAQVDASDALLQGNRVYGAVVSGGGASLTLTDADVLDTEPGEAAGLGGGLLAQGGGSLVAARVTVAGATAVGILVDGSEAVLTDVEVQGTARGLDQSAASGLAIQRASAVEGSEVVVADTQGPGLVVSDATGTCTDCRVSRNAFAGLVVVSGGDLTYTDGRIADTVPDANLSGGVGVLVDGPRSALGLERTVVTGNLNAAVMVVGDAEVSLLSNTLDGGPAERAVWPAGTGVFASGTTAGGLWLGDNDLQNSGGAGLFLDDASATLAGNRWVANAIDVVQQLCGDAPPPVGLDEAGSVELCPAYDRPVELLSFATVYQPLDLAAR